MTGMSDETGEKQPVSRPMGSIEAIEQVRQLGRIRRDLETQLKEANDRLAASLATAREMGYSWPDLAEAAQLLNADAARLRAQPSRELSAVADNFENVTVTEASRRLGLSRKTIYQWIRADRLIAVTDPSGRTRVRLPKQAERGTRPPSSPEPTDAPQE